MKAGAYLRAASLDQAVAALEADGIALAGGTDVMVKGRGRNVYAARTIVDLSAVPELHTVEERAGDGAAGSIEIGAACTLSGLCSHVLLRARLPLLVDAMEHVGGVQTRNRATIGGNVVNACPASDVIPALMVLDARVRTTRRELSIAELFRDCPQCLRHEGMIVRTCFFPDAAAKKTVLEQGELVCSIVVPAQAEGSRWLFHKHATTQGIGLGRLNVALLENASKAAVGRQTACPPRPTYTFSMGGLFSKPCVLHASSPEDAHAVLAQKISAECTALADYDHKLRVAPALLADAIAALQAGEALERKRR